MRRTRTTAAAARRGPLACVPLCRWLQPVIAAVAVACTGPADDRPAVAQVSYELTIDRDGGGRISVAARDVPLRILVGELAQRLAVTTTLETPLDEPVTVYWHGLSPEQVWQRLLRAHSYVYATGQGGLRLHVYPRNGTGVPELEDTDMAPDRVEAVPDAGSPASLRVLTTRQDDPDPLVRAEAVRSLAGAAEAEYWLARALTHSDTLVRETAIETLGELATVAATDALELALRDRDAELRAEAVEALAAIGTARALELMQVALYDDDRVVRIRAAGYLEAGPAL